MKVLPVNKQLEILKHLAEGHGIRPTARCAIVRRESCLSLMLRFGEACRRFLDREMRDLQLTHLEIDEMWTFCRKKQKNVQEGENDRYIGDQYLFIALDEPTRLIPGFRIGKRDMLTTMAFLSDLFMRLKKPKPHESDAHDYKKEGYKPIIRISTDSFEPYTTAIPAIFGDLAEYAQITKDFTADGGKPKKKTIRSKDKVPIPDELISTSLVERSNLTTRTFMKRFNRKTMGFSKKAENLKAATAFYLVYYNYCRVHRTLKTTPAVAAELIDRPLKLYELYAELVKSWPELFHLPAKKKGAA